MKYLLLFSLTFSLHAKTIQYTVESVVFGSLPSNMEESVGTAWKAKNIANNSWGRPARQIMEDSIKDWELARATGYTEVIVQPYEAAREVEQCIVPHSCIYELAKDDEYNACVDSYTESCEKKETVTIPAVPERKMKNYNVPADYVITETTVTAEVEAAAAQAVLIASGYKDQQKCKDALAYIGGYNRANKTAAEIDAMAAEFALIFQALQANRPDTALALINANANTDYAELKAVIIKILE